MRGALLEAAEAAQRKPTPRRSVIRGWLGGASYYLHVALATLVMGLWGALTQLPKGFRGANRVATGWVEYMLHAARWHMGVAVELRGTPPALDEDALIAAKHQSFLDVLAIADAARRRAFVMKREVLRIPVMGWYARRVGCIPIDRRRGRDALSQIISEIEARRKSPEGLGHLIFYPEGTRTQPGEHRPYKHGISVVHEATGLPVYPVAVNCGLFWPKRGIPVASGRAIIEFLPPMTAAPGESRDAFLERLRTEIEQRSDSLMAEAGFVS